METSSTIHQLQAALFSQAPKVGDINPPGEVSYEGYHRVTLLILDGKNMEPVVFQLSDQDEPVFVTHVVALDYENRVVGVKELSSENLIRD